MRRAVSAVLLVLALLLGALVLARLLETGMIFFPARYPLGVWDPARLGVEATEHSFRTADGVTLYAWWFPARADAEGDAPADDGGPVLLWAHGNAGNLTGRAVHAGAIAQRGLSVLVFDYRGYGKSEGRPSEQGIYVDTEAAYEFLVNELGVAPRRIVLLGRSLGAAPAARLATQVPHTGLVLIAPMPSARRMARRMFGGLPVDLLVRARFPVTEWVAQRDTPLLVMHGDADEIIPLDYGREVFAAAAEPKQFVTLANAGHNDILAVSGEAYLDALEAFARAAVDASLGSGSAPRRP